MTWWDDKCERRGGGGPREGAEGGGRREGAEGDRVGAGQSTGKPTRERERLCAQYSSTSRVLMFGHVRSVRVSIAPRPMSLSYTNCPTRHSNDTLRD